jgi:hypothetical protein
MLKILLFLSLSLPLISLEQVQIQANDLLLEDHSFSTTSQAVVTSSQIRIQANTIVYERNLKAIEPIHRISGKDNVMISFGGRVLIADEVEYDFIQKKGIVKNGITYDNLFFISAKEILLDENQTLTFIKGSITTSEMPQAEFSIDTQRVVLKQKESLSAKHIVVRYSSVPIFYLPYFYASLKKNEDSKIQYKVTWDSGQGPKFSMRYGLLTSDTLDLFLRFDFRINRGLAGAVESDFLSLNEKTAFQTKNYVAHDTFFNDSNPNQKKTRYRLQGIYSHQNEEKDFLAFMRYDKYSDPNMPLDFEGDDFELNTALKTELIVQKSHPLVSLDFYLSPKINSFQGFKQEIPSLTLGFTPLTLESLGLIFENRINCSYLNYQYNQDLEIPISSFRSARVEVNESLSRPFDAKFIKIKPYATYRGIFYSDNPSDSNVFENLLIYGVQGISTFKKNFAHTVHLMQPYFDFYQLSHVTNQQHYVFSYEDGFDPYKALRFGIKNTFMTDNSKWNIDLFGFQFFNQKNLSNIPKVCLNWDVDFSKVYFDSTIIYNTQNACFDQANFGLLWTVNQYLALKAEFRHRSQFGFRKVNYEDFTLDVNQNLNELIHSPISIRRNAANFSTQINVTKATFLRYESNIGWGRENQPFYHEFKVDLLTMIATNWRLKLSYMHLVNDHQVAVGISLVPNN